MCPISCRRITALRRSSSPGCAPRTWPAPCARASNARTVRDLLHEEIRRGILNIAVTGKVIGQVNGLSVPDAGAFSFGLPARIRATTRLGEGEVVDIEREVDMGGPVHSKGVFILSSFLGARYAQNSPLSLSASLAFEHAYSGVEGDSASLAELCALLSSLASCRWGRRSPSRSVDQASRAGKSRGISRVQQQRPGAAAPGRFRAAAHGLFRPGPRSISRHRREGGLRSVRAAAYAASRPRKIPARCGRSG